jgi:hypothetical protein
MIRRLPYLTFRWFYAVKHLMTRRFTTAGLLVLAATAASGAVGMDTNQTMAYQGFAFLTCLLLLAILGGVAFRGRFTVSRVLPRFGTVGEPLSYRILVENGTRKPQRGLQVMEEF